MGTEFVVPMAIKVILMIIVFAVVLSDIYLHPEEGERRTIIHIHHHHINQHRGGK